MRRLWLALLLALCCLLCMACASGETKQLVTADGLTQEAAVNTQQPVVLYSFETKSVEKEYRAEDGTLMATAHYALPVLTASNAAGNKLETETITVRRVNSYFADWLSREELWFCELGASAEGRYSQLAGEPNNPWNEEGYYYIDEMTPSFWSNGRLACVEMQGYSFTGGVHGYTTRAAAAFDLSDGRSVAVSDLSRGWSGLQQAVTREQLASILYRLSGKPAVSASLRSYTDASDVSAYAVDAMRWAVGCGYRKGSGAKLNPQTGANRAEVAVLLHRYLTK